MTRRLVLVTGLAGLVLGTNGCCAALGVMLAGLSVAVGSQGQASEILQILGATMMQIAAVRGEDVSVDSSDPSAGGFSGGFFGGTGSSSPGSSSFSNCTSPGG